MKYITKERVEEIIDTLSDKTLTFECKIISKYDKYEMILVGDEAYGEGFRYYQPASGKCLELTESELAKILGHPVRIGDVMDKIISDSTGVDDHGMRIVGLWADCGLSKSLQQIIEKSGFIPASEWHKEYEIRDDELVLKSPEANNLFVLLDQLFPKK